MEEAEVKTISSSLKKKKERKKEKLKKLMQLADDDKQAAAATTAQAKEAEHATTEDAVTEDFSQDLGKKAPAVAPSGKKIFDRAFLGVAAKKGYKS